ncbi:OLC1v1005916C1 [Oldenlandia corymbosa var. corymbosa]|uniref:OLC1v1005916C1 n=1 Tax=Oldenlandia corymbosa var. corymbosa TaxID=529605 RepID=A0AAV1DG79_OLDCO|nr:OLC1v1005916C1 [Oldenlandia corymbosa var. corymbosa]
MRPQGDAVRPPQPAKPDMNLHSVDENPMPQKGIAPPAENPKPAQLPSRKESTNPVADSTSVRR